MSILIRAFEPVPSLDSLPLTAALATASVLRSKVRATVRWPNDVVVDGRKIAGTLVESRSKGNELVYVVIGIGINANVDTSKIEPIKGSSTSLQALLGTPVDREELITALLSELEQMYESISGARESVLLPALVDLDWSTGRHVRVRTADRSIAGCFDGYESLSRARIRTSRGLELVWTGAVVAVDYESD